MAKVNKKDLMVIGLTGETVLRYPGQIAGNQFIVDRLKNCTVNVLDNMDSAQIDDCEGCEMVLGPSESSVFVRDCKDCVFHVVSQQLRTRNCINCTFYLWVPTDPVIESSHGLKIGEWNIEYAGLEAQYRAANLCPTDENHCTAIYDFTPDEEPKPHWTAAPPAPATDLSALLGVDAGQPAPAPAAKPSPAPAPGPPSGVALPSVASAAAAAAAAAEQARYWKVVFNAVAVRDQPAKSGAEIGERYKGEVVEVAAQQGDWLRLQPPPGYRGTSEHWMLSKAGSTVLLSPVPLEDVPMSARMASPRSEPSNRAAHPPCCLPTARRAAGRGRKCSARRARLGNRQAAARRAAAARRC
eukprot:SAG11_NODE_964_length_6369_cov_7.399362_4_plen_355_part_00